ncbi:MAG: adenylyl-sulfate kinase [Pseudomonadales bacterium]|nr:adenylyl-sulfate kinase [Pseudomonadales bacterium]
MSLLDTKETKATNVHWHDGEIGRLHRARMLGQVGATLWFTGLSGSGKSTIAVALENRLMAKGYLCYRLDGDNIRMGINRNLGFSAEDRTENIRRVGEVSKLFVDAGFIVLSSFISPYEEDRQLVRALHAQLDMSFIEIFVDCPLVEAERRDPKGLYAKARAGEIKNFTGIDDPYETPTHPDIHLTTSEMNLEQEVDLIVNYLEEKHLIGKHDMRRASA